MPSHDLKCDVARAVRVGIMALGFVAFTGPAVMILSSLEASAREDGEKSGDDKSGTRVGAKVADRNAAAGTSGGVKIFRGLVGGDGAGVSIHRVPTNAGAASSPARANANTGAGLARTSQGTGAGPKAAFAAAPATAATAGVGIGNHPATAGPTGTAVGFGGDSFASGSVGFGFGGGSDGGADGPSTIGGDGRLGYTLCVRNPVPPAAGARHATLQGGCRPPRAGRAEPAHDLPDAAGDGQAVT